MPKKKWAAAAVLIGMLAAAFFYVLRTAPRENKITEILSTEEAFQGTAESTEESSYVVVYVCGAVNSPGVYQLPAGSRKADALAMAGGFAEGADSMYVNLAEVISDGEQLWFPSGEEAASLEAAREAERSGMVNINTAGLEELMTLPGIGESKAKAILAYRRTEGSFKSVEDIMKVSGIKEAAYLQICDRITVE